MGQLVSECVSGSLAGSIGWCVGGWVHRCAAKVFTPHVHCTRSTPEAVVLVVGCNMVGSVCLGGSPYAVRARCEYLAKFDIKWYHFVHVPMLYGARA